LSTSGRKEIAIYIAGDSTAANKTPDVFPETGWGQVIGDFFNENVKINNHAVNGRSSKSFVEEGRLEAILKEIKAGDYLFIQFGHNDEKEQGAYPVLLTPVNRRLFENGRIINTHREYCKAMKELALELNVPLIDVCEKSRALFEELGEEKTKEIFLWVEPGQYPAYPEGKQDNTHFSRQGAIEIAKLIVDGIKNDIDLPLKNFLKV